MRLERHDPNVFLFETPCNKYFYDVNTNTINSIGEDLYYYLKNGTKTEKAIADFSRYKKLGYLSSKRPQEIRHSLDSSLEERLNHEVEQITLQITQQCNFRCAYCVYTPKDFMTQRSHSELTMDTSVALEAIKFYAKHSINCRKKCIGFYGGEPLLNFDLIEKVVKFAEKQFFGNDILFTVTTNGSLLTKEIALFLQEHNFNLMISLDGAEEVHNRSRKFAVNGKGTFGVIYENIKMLQHDFPDLYKRTGFNVVVDPRYSCVDMHNFFTNDSVFQEVAVQSTLIDDFFSIEKVIPSDQFREESYINQVKAYIAQISTDSQIKTSRITKFGLEADIEKTTQHLHRQKELPDIAAPSGPCVPGQRRLFVDIKGDLFPCERVSEFSAVMNIGSIYDGFNFKRAHDILNIGSLTADECKECWAFRHCTICARLCDNNGKLSKELKRSNCQEVRERVAESFKEYIMLKEMSNIRICE